MTPRRVLTVVPDLFFATRIAATARMLGVELVECPGPGALEACRDSLPDLVILDLGSPGDPIAVASALKADAATRAVPIVGFCSHVDQETRRAAVAAGVDEVLPKSAFTARLPGLLSGAPRRDPHSGA